MQAALRILDVRMSNGYFTCLVWPSNFELEDCKYILGRHAECVFEDKIDYDSLGIKSSLMVV